MDFHKNFSNNEEYELMSTGCSGNCDDAQHSKGVYSSNLIKSGSCASATTCNSPKS